MSNDNLSRLRRHTATGCGWWSTFDGTSRYSLKPLAPCLYVDEDDSGMLVVKACHPEDSECTLPIDGIKTFDIEQAKLFVDSWTFKIRAQTP